jgi:hypothetical protein
MTCPKLIPKRKKLTSKMTIMKIKQENKIKFGAHSLTLCTRKRNLCGNLKMGTRMK